MPSVRVERNGVPWEGEGRVRRLYVEGDPSAIEVRTVAGTHVFVFHTGFRGGEPQQRLSGARL